MSGPGRPRGADRNAQHEGSRASRRWLRSLAVTAALLPASGGGWSQTATPAPPAAAASASASAPAAGDAVLETARRSVRSTTEWLARGVDSWFGDKPPTEGGQVSNGLLSLNLIKRQGERADPNVRFGARFRLPNVEQRAYLFVGRDDQREIVTDKPEAFSRQQLLLPQRNADRAFFAGFGLSLPDAADFRLGFRGGLKPYAQARYWKGWQFGDQDLIDFRQTLFWTLDDRLGSTTALSYAHGFSPTLAGRWLNAATITQRSRKFEWSSIFGLHQSHGTDRLLSLELLFSGRQGADVRVADYGLQLKWLQPIHQDWLLGEIIVGQFHPRPDLSRERIRAWALGGGLRMKF